MDYKKELDRLNKRFNALKQTANTWLSTWKDIKTYVAPSRGYFEDNANDGTSHDHRTLLDSTAVKDLTTLASGLMTGLTSPNRPWFKLAFNDPIIMENKDVADWLYIVERRMELVFHESNIYSALYNIYEELGSFSTGAMSVLEDDETVIYAENYTCGEYYIGHNRKGFINSFARRFDMTVGQLVDKFGYDSCSREVRRLYDEQQHDEWIKVIHLIEENNNREVGKIDKLNKPFISYYWEEGKGKDDILSVGGFDEFPIMAPRWSVPTNMDTYSKSGPAWNALGDIKMVQKMQKDKLMGIQKMVDPPVQVDSSVNELNLLPGGVSRSSAQTPNAGIRSAYTVNLNLRDLDIAIQNTRNDIGDHFFRNLFLAITYSDNKGMTATEVAERHAEKLLVIGPVLLKLQKELLNKLIDRTFSIMIRKDLVPIPPKIVQGRDFSIEYISTLAQAQKEANLINIQKAFEFAGAVSSIDPRAADVLDARQAVQEYSRTKGLNPFIIRSDEQLRQIDEQRAQQQQQQQQIQNAQMMVQGAKELSQTGLDNRNALTELVGIENAGQEAQKI